MGDPLDITSLDARARKLGYEVVAEDVPVLPMDARGKGSPFNLGNGQGVRVLRDRHPLLQVLMKASEVAYWLGFREREATQSSATQTCTESFVVLPIAMQTFGRLGSTQSGPGSRAGSSVRPGMRIAQSTFPSGCRHGGRNGRSRKWLVCRARDRVRCHKGLRSGPTRAGRRFCSFGSGRVVGAELRKKS